MDILLFAMLVICILYCRKLERRIANLKSKKNGFIKLIKDFELTFSKAESDIAELQNIGQDLRKKLQRSIESGVKLTRELKDINDLADQNLYRLDEKIMECKKLNKNNMQEKSMAVDARGKQSSNFIESFKNNAARASVQNMLKSNSTITQNSQQNSQMFSSYREYNILKKA